VFIRYRLPQPLTSSQYPSVAICRPSRACVGHGHSHLAGVANAEFTGERTNTVGQLRHTDDHSGTTLDKADQFANKATTATDFPGFRTIKNKVHRSGHDDKSAHVLSDFSASELSSTILRKTYEVAPTGGWNQLPRVVPQKTKPRVPLIAYDVLMLVGLLSDTHGFLDEAIFTYFEKCDEVWHAGDFGPVEVLDRLKMFKPLRGVFGNIDGADIRAELTLDLEWKCEGLRVYMTHQGGYPGSYDRRVKKDLELRKPDLFIRGHSHIVRVMRDRSRLKPAIPTWVCGGLVGEAMEMARSIRLSTGAASRYCGLWRYQK